MEESPSPRGSPKSSEEIPIHLSRNRQRKLMMPPGVGQNPEEIKNLVCRELDVEHIANVDVLINSYYGFEDLVLRHCIKDEKKRENMVKDYFVPQWRKYVFKQGHIYGVINTDTNNVEGITCAFAPEDSLNINVKNLILNAFQNPLKFGFSNFSKFLKVQKKLALSNKIIMGKIKHWRIMYPSPASCIPSAGRMLMNSLIKWASSAGVPIYHEVWLMEHVHYYEAYGFEVLGGQIIKKDLESNSSGDLFEEMHTLQYWVVVKWPSQGSGNLEDAVSIVKDAEKRRMLIDSVPHYKFLPCSDEKVIISIFGPDEQGSLQDYEDWVAAQSVTTYPLEPISKQRQGEPNADSFELIHFEKCTIVAVADGCGWGEQSKIASRKATRKFCEYMNVLRTELSGSTNTAKLLLRAFEVANKAIIEGSREEEIFENGTTTLLGGIVVELDQSEIKMEKNFIFLFANLGDCKAYYYDCKTKSVSDITTNARSNDPKDPGGRIGPYLTEKGLPDLRNLTIDHTLCKEGDIILILTDGVHDNLDPEALGKSALDLGIQDPLGWKSKDIDLVLKQKRKYANNFLEGIIEKNSSLKAITKSLIDFSLDLTHSSREFLENPKNRNSKLPKNFQQYPGKMDHTTCLVFKIGNRIQ